MPMTPEQRELWSKIAAFEIDDPASDFRFSHRLARENGWSHAYAAEVIDEYRRFVFLAFAAGHPVTPSADVDEAWHLHLLYTRSYWEDLCRDTLGGPLHHGPTRGGKAEADKFADWYGCTLESYQRLFDRPAPARIWPDSKARFAAASRTVHVRPATHWIVRKPHVVISKSLVRAKWNPPGRMLAVIAVASLGALAVTGCVAAGGGQANGAGFTNPVTTFDAKRFLIFYPLAWIVLMALTTWFQRMLLNEPVPDETVREFEHAAPETIALLQEQLAQRHRLAELLTARLFAHGRIRFDAGKKRLVRADHGPKPVNAFDAEMLAVIEAGENAASPPQLASYAAEIRERPLVRSAIDRLRQKDLFLETAPLRFAQGAGMAAIMIWLAIGVARAQVGLARHRPIGFLIVEMILGGLIGLSWMTGPVLRSRYSPAAKILRRLERATAGRIPAPRQRFADENAGSANEDDWRSVAVAGLCVLPATGLFREYLTCVQPPSCGDGGGGDGGGGDGGGGDGGGGCGGCGG